MLEQEGSLRECATLEDETCIREPIERVLQFCLAPLRGMAAPICAISFSVGPSRSSRASSEACKLGGIANDGIDRSRA
jgi:hypothetical protein